MQIDYLKKRYLAVKKELENGIYSFNGSHYDDRSFYLGFLTGLELTFNALGEGEWLETNELKTGQ